MFTIDMTITFYGCIKIYYLLTNCQLIVALWKRILFSKSSVYFDEEASLPKLNARFKSSSLNLLWDKIE